MFMERIRRKIRKTLQTAVIVMTHFRSCVFMFNLCGGILTTARIQEVMNMREWMFTEQSEEIRPEMRRFSVLLLNILENKE